MSGRHILLTGPPGIGKTTVIRNTCTLLKNKDIQFHGFFTEEVRNGKERIGFDVVTTSGKRSDLARISDSVTGAGRPKVGKYAVNVSSFEALALPVFDHNPTTVLILDELGKMESFSKLFMERAKSAFAKDDIKILGTIPVKSQIPLVNELKNRKDCLVIEVTRENRDSLPHEIVQKITNV